MEFDFDLENPLLTSCDNISLLFSIETDHIPSKSYLQRLGRDEGTGSSFSNRCEIISFIHRFAQNFDYSSVSYLAVNYMDRFLSAQPSLDVQKPWILKLVAVSCVSLAVKMSKTKFRTSDLKSGIVDSLTVERMEVLILGALKWRMRSVNPFSFLGFYISLFELKNQASAQLLRSKAVEIIFKTQTEIKLLEFNPSIVSASALLCAAGEVCPLLLPYISEAVSGCEYVNKENLFKCYDVMREIAAIDGDESSSCTNPADVFESENRRIILSGINTTISYDRNRLLIERPKLGNFNNDV